MGKPEALLDHYPEWVTHPSINRAATGQRAAWPAGEGAGRLRGPPRRCARSSLPHPPGQGRPSAENEETGERASRSLQGWLICGDSARTARLAGAQVRDLREGSGRPQGPSRPTFPDSLGSMTLLAVARADPATASRPPPPPAAWPEDAAAATTLGTGAPRRAGRPGGEGARPGTGSPTSGGR